PAARGLRAEALGRPVGGRGGGQRDDVADLRVVDGVLDSIGEDRVAVGHVEGQVEVQSLPDLLLGVGDAVVRVDGEAADLDLDCRLRGALVLVHPAKLACRERLSRPSRRLSWNTDSQTSPSAGCTTSPGARASRSSSCTAFPSSGSSGATSSRTSAPTTRSTRPTCAATTSPAS